MRWVRRFSRLFQTVRHLRFTQIYHRVYRVKPVVFDHAPPALRAVSGHWVSSIARQNAQTGPCTFRFLNEERRIETWNDPGIPKLWLYNLHYQECPTAELIALWIDGNPPVAAGNGWEPYPSSLRICNWIKWWLAGNECGEGALRSLAMQVRYLEQNIEYHLLGNHLLANGKALIFAGTFFNGPEAERWRTKGLSILDHEMCEQVLADGGHYERSPMYHSILLEDMLDLINLAGAFPGMLPEWKPLAGRMLKWLEQMCHPDGDIAFFNDAAFGIAPKLESQIGYARRLNVAAFGPGLADSGYIRLENEKAVLLFDAALIGPDYQPGHGHADTLCFELSVGGNRCIVNSGTSTYEKNQERHRQRGTSAHNTLAVDGLNSSDVWSAFRVGRRARVFGVATDGHTYAEASHDGYAYLRDSVIHTRRIELLEHEVRITDTLRAKGRGAHSVMLYFHLNPNSETQINLDSMLSRRQVCEPWFPEFNVAIPSRTVIGHWVGSFPVKFITSIPLQ